METKKPQKTAYEFSLPGKDNHRQNWQNLFSVKLKYSAQATVLSGIDIEMLIQYKGKDDFTVHNPLYFILYMFTDKRGNVLELIKKPRILSVNKQGLIDETKDFDFTIKFVKRNNAIVNLQQEVNRWYIEFKENSTMKYSLNISPDIKNREGRGTKLARGDYQIRYSFSIVPVNETKYDALTNQYKSFEITFTE
ncbi:MAG: hypothetical protein ABI760_11640 [Ferruginibacter sp.]